MKYAVFNIDLDPAVCYYAIHGLEYDNKIEDPIITIALPRFLNLLKEEGIKATFFVTALGIGSKGLEILRQAAADGHEIANHSFSHDYRLTLQSEAEILADLKKNDLFIRENIGAVPTGFRAPGYNINEKIFMALRKLNYTYDSSSFPSFLYYAAKWLILKLKKLAGRPSRSIITSFAESFCTNMPHNVSDIKEFPITTVFRPFGLPLIGTSIITFPEFILGMMMSSAASRNYINIEAHGIDMADRNDSPVYGPLIGRQPDLKHNIDKKTERFKLVIRRFKDEGFSFVRLDELSKIKTDGTSE